MSPQVRALVPLEDGPDGPVGLGQVVDVSDEQAQVWRAAGKVSLVADEEASAKAAEHGHYSDVTTRDDVAGTPGGQTPGPQADDDDDEPKSRKGKK